MIEQQSQTFLVCVCLGVCIGVLIEFFIALKKVISIRAGLLGTVDILFWLAFCGTVIWTTFVYNSGQIRFYIFFGFFSGIGIYFSTINWVVAKILDYILGRLKNGFKKVIFWMKKLVDISCSKR